jgi:hypothetical protein
MTIRRTITTALLAAAAAVILAGCNTDKPAAPAKPGDAKVYATIDISTSCTQLQGWHDLYYEQSKTYIYNGDARKDDTMAYMKYTQDRMDTLKCFG